MKIGMMSPWNTTCGVSVHAELIGREFIKMGHKLVVFAPIEPLDKKATNIDEEFVIRCYTFNRRFLGFNEPAEYFDANPLLEFDGEAFIVENLELMPIMELSRIWREISGKKILVIHEGSLPMFYEFYSLDWDKIVCFDERYIKLFSKQMDREKFTIIPYPYHELRLGSKEEARKRLGLPLDKKIVFTFGLRITQHFRTLPVLEKLSKEFKLIYLIIPSEEIPREVISRVKNRYSFVKFRREEMLTKERLYEYLHAADALLLYKTSPNIVVSSTVCLCLGSGCPIVINKGKYSETLGEEVFKFDGPRELEETLRGLFNEELTVNMNAVKRVLEENSARRVASMFINLIKSL